MGRDVYLSVPEARDFVISRGFGPLTGQTIRYWCKVHGIGIKIGGRWKVSGDKLKQFLDGAKNE
jgi:hypothetical protein